METVQLMEITSRECRKYIENGGDLVFIPIGSVERLGPHLPMGARTHVACAIANEFAKKNNGYCLPPVSYSTCYNTACLKGTIDINHDILYDLCYDLSKELVANGFRRIMFVGYFKEFYYLISEFFQNEGIAIAWINPDHIPMESPSNANERETSLVAACLKLLGKDDVCERLIEENRKHLGKFSERKSIGIIRELKKFGNIGLLYEEGDYEVLPAKNIYIEETINDIYKWIDEKNIAVDSLKDYNYYLSRRRPDRGLK